VLKVSEILDRDIKLSIFKYSKETNNQFIYKNQEIICKKKKEKEVRKKLVVN
jgi:hypothetical protein